MLRVSNGYTVLEVMIFLAVSSVLITSAWNLISGKQEQTSFDQKMRETQSKLQQWISDVSTGVSNGDPSRQYCDNSSGRPEIINPPPSRPANYSPQCIFLGKAIQFTDHSLGLHTSPNQDSTLYIYSVFGCRYSGCNSTPVLPPDMYSANPEPAIGLISGVLTYADLTQTFDVSPAYVKSVCDNPPSCSGSHSHLIGFMNSFNTDENTAVNGSENLNVYLYKLNNNDAPANDLINGVQVKQCLEGNGGPCNLAALPSPNNNPPSLQSYQLCLSDGKYSAQITISSASGIGASTQLDYIAC